MNFPTTIAKVSAWTAVGYFVYVLIVNTAHLAAHPWYRSPFFTIGGSSFAVLGIATGILAFVCGRARLDSCHKQYAAVGIISGVCYLFALVGASS